MAQQQMQMQQMQMQQMQQMQQWQQMHQLQQMQSMVGGPMARGVHLVRYQAIPSRASFAQPMMMRPQMSQMMGRKKQISRYYYLGKVHLIWQGGDEDIETRSLKF